MTECYIEEIGKHVGEEVTLKGWVYNTRSSGKVRFIIFRDGTGMIQAVLAKGETPEEDFARFDQLTQESSIIISGPVKEEPRAEGGYEMMVKNLEIVQVSRTIRSHPRSTLPVSSWLIVISGCVRPGSITYCEFATKSFRPFVSIFMNAVTF